MSNYNNQVEEYGRRPAGRDDYRAPDSYDTGSRVYFDGQQYYERRGDGGNAFARSRSTTTAENPTRLRCRDTVMASLLGSRPAQDRVQNAMRDMRSNARERRGASRRASTRQVDQQPRLEPTYADDYGMYPEPRLMPRARTERDFTTGLRDREFEYDQASMASSRYAPSEQSYGRHVQPEYDQMSMASSRYPSSEQTWVQREDDQMSMASSRYPSSQRTHVQSEYDQASMASSRYPSSERSYGKVVSPDEDRVSIASLSWPPTPPLYPSKPQRRRGTESESSYYGSQRG